MIIVWYKKMVCVFCGHLTSGPSGTENWICSLCMRNLAQELHSEEKLGVKKVETYVVARREVGFIIRHGRISWP
jgi:hypothetical protein